MGAGAFWVDILLERSLFLPARHAWLCEERRQEVKEVYVAFMGVLRLSGTPMVTQSDHAPHSIFIISMCPACWCMGSPGAGGMSVLVAIRAVLVPVTAPGTQQLLMKYWWNKSAVNVEVIPLTELFPLVRCTVTL